jgi:hypothetical protein
MSFWVTVSALAVFWCVVNIFKPMPRLGISSRMAAFVLFVFALMALVGTWATLADQRNQAFEALKVSDPKAYLAAVRQGNGDDAYLAALKEVDPARWKKEAPGIQASLDKAKHNKEVVAAAKALEEALKDSDQEINRDAWIAKGQEAVASTLKDPSSAQFRKVFFHMAKIEGKNVPMSCGEVNSKNSFGGYNGYQRYISAGTPDLSYLEEEVADFGKAWKLMCVK